MVPWCRVQNTDTRQSYRTVSVVRLVVTPCHSTQVTEPVVSRLSDTAGHISQPARVTCALRGQAALPTRPRARWPLPPRSPHSMHGAITTTSARCLSSVRRCRVPARSHRSPIGAEMSANASRSPGSGGVRGGGEGRRLGSGRVTTTATTSRPPWTSRRRRDFPPSTSQPTSAGRPN